MDSNKPKSNLGENPACDVEDVRQSRLVFSRMGHDLNNVLTKLALLTELIEDETAKSVIGQVDEKLREISQSCYEMSEDDD